MDTTATLTAVEKEGLALDAIAACGEAWVAFSGGVDSTYLVDLAREALGDKATAVTADSPSLARSHLEWARRFCAERGIRHEIVASGEFADPAYLANDGERCYHCKSALLAAMTALDGVAGGAALLLGAIADDLADWRPGMRAAAERGARFPLADAGMTKAELRERSLARGLPGHDRPAQPCLSSRIPYGEAVTPEAVRMIEAAETVLQQLGFASCRARHHRIGTKADGSALGVLCRIEVPEDQLARAIAARRELVERIRACGYLQVALDLDGLRSGGLNRLIGKGS